MNDNRLYIMKDFTYALFHKDCTRHSAPCGASATECKCKYTAFIFSNQMFMRLFVFLPLIPSSDW